MLRMTIQARIMRNMNSGSLSSRLMTNESQPRRFLADHIEATRRYFLQMGAVGIAALQSSSLLAGDDASKLSGDESLQAAIDALEPWLTPASEFRDVSRGKPIPHTLSDERRAEVGLTRDTWKLEVISDSDHPSTLGNPMSNERSNAFDFAKLMKLSESKAVRFPKVMTCLNIGCPLGMGIWEGVPMRDVVWMAEPKENLRRVFYYGYHNDDEGQMFRSSLPIGRVLEDTFGLPPVILCYKLNGEWLSPERGGPVRVVVPEAYGFKSVKWLTHLVLSNLSHANDTYAEKNNDVDSDLKTFCATISIPESITPGQPIPITGWAQSGIAGLSKVQVWIQDRSESWPAEDPHFQKAPWRDATLLAAPSDWGGALHDPGLMRQTQGFDSESGRPLNWPLRLAKAHWAILHDGLEAGRYVLRCRTVDENGVAQPMPRPFRKSGHAAIEARGLIVA